MKQGMGHKWTLGSCSVEGPWQEVWSTHSLQEQRLGKGPHAQAGMGGQCWAYVFVAAFFHPLILCLLECLMIMLRINLPHMSFIISQTLRAQEPPFFVLGLCSSFPQGRTFQNLL